jgi:hypothetical protein
MFSEMIADLEKGILPDPAPLRGRCHAAVTKKLAFVRLPPVYWESDPKRNPDSSHLLWATLLLQDSEMLEVVKGIILMEQAEREGLSLEEFMQHSLDALFALAPDGQFQTLLKERVSLAASLNGVF